MECYDYPIQPTNTNCMDLDLDLNEHPDIYRPTMI